MARKYSTDLKNDRLQQNIDRADAGVGVAVIKICDGAEPAFGGALTNVLATIPMNDPSWNAPSGGQILLNGTPKDTNATGGGSPATWYVVEDSAGVRVEQGSAGESGTDLIISSANISNGDEVTALTFTITHGN